MANRNTPSGRDYTPVRPGKPVKTGTGGTVTSGTGSTVRSRSFGEPSVVVRPAYIDPAAMDRVDREMHEEHMAKHLDMPVESYRQATRGGAMTPEPTAGMKPAKVTTEDEPLYLAKGGVVRDCGGDNDHMASSRGVDRLPAGAKHSKR